MSRLALFLIAVCGCCLGQKPEAVRFASDPLITLSSSTSVGDNINGPAIIRVPEWVAHPLGRYYLYFAHHKGDHIRLAYADKLEGPWTVYEPGVLNVRETAFYRLQPDPKTSPDTLYTHVASPEIFIDNANRQLLMFVHGMFTNGQAWPATPSEALAWMRDNKFAQFTQTTMSRDGIHFVVRPGITARTSYLRVFSWHNSYYSLSRLGVAGHAEGPLGNFELGPSVFAGGAYEGKVRHVGVVLRGDFLYVFFSAIGDAPERILLSTISLTDDWRSWRASEPMEVIAPREKYDCVALPAVASRAGESEGPENALRDPDLIDENGRVTLFYSYCGEQGIAAADVTSFVSGQARSH